MCSNELLGKPLFCLPLGSSRTALVVYRYFPRKENQAWGNSDLPKVAQLESSGILVNTSIPYRQEWSLHDSMLILLGGGVCLFLCAHICGIK